MAGDKDGRHDEGLQVQAASTELNDLNPIITGAGTSQADIAVTQIVFIDGSVPDAQALAAGVAPGVVAVLLDPNRDGVQQIADYLTSHDVHSVAAIDIVAHGADGMIQLGNALLGAATIADYQTQLAEIGDALRPGGDIQLYGCDVAQDATGDAFLQQLSQATGGANIAASSHLVGAAAEGGNWTLNVDVGTVDVTTPFTTSALSSYPDLLSVASNQIFFAAFNGESGPNATGNRIEQIGVNTSTFIAGSTVDIADTSQSIDSGLIATSSGLAVDTALNKYFVAVDQATTGTLASIQVGNITGAGGLSTLYTAPFPNFDTFPNSASNYSALGGFALDAQNGTLYFAQVSLNSDGFTNDEADTGIYEISVTGGAATRVNSVSSLLINPAYLALDIPANLVFFDDSFLGTTSNNLDVLNLSSHSITVLHTFSSSDPNLLLQGMDINTTTNTLYVATADNTDHTKTGNAILSIPFSVTGSAGTATASIVSIGTLYSGAGAFQPSDIVIDPAQNIFYTSGEQFMQNAGSNFFYGAVFEGSLSGGSSLTEVESMSSIVATAAATDAQIPQLVLLQQPIVTASGTVTANTGGSAVTVDSGATVTEPNNQLIANAAVTGALTGDTLGYNGGTPHVFVDGHTITSSFSTGTLTLSGVATAADYQSALDAITFATTSTSATPRSIGWTVNDGVVLSATAVSTVDVHVPPAITAGATATFTGGGGAAVALDPGLIVTDASSTSLAGATIVVAGFIAGDVLTVGTPGALSIGGINNGTLTTGTLTLTGTASIATYQSALASVQYSFNPGNGDPAGGATKRASSSISWIVNDGTVASPAAASTLDIVHIAPSVTAGASVSYLENSPPIVLDAGLSVTDVDSGGMLAGATVSIGNGFLSGDTLGFKGPIGITGTYSAGVLELSGSDTIANYDSALQSVTYSFAGDPTNGGTDTSRTISWVVNDGAASSAADTSSVATLCFCAGTRIATPDGEVPVEQLAVGDLVLTLDGRAEPIRWIGTGQSLLAPGRRSESTPVIVRADALDYGVPERDLRITKGHSLYLEGVLIPVENLINHRSIVWDDAARSVVVYHLELDTHEVLLADGAPAESYRDDGNRRQFQNVNPGWDTGAAPEPFAPIVTNGPVVAEVWRRLLQRTEPCAPIPLTGDPDVHLLVDGTRVAPCDVVDGCHVFEAVAGSDIRIASRCAAPAELGENYDQRRLGIAVRRIVMYQCGVRLEIDAASPMLAEGFHGYEAADGFRWTDGAGLLPVSLHGEFIAGEPIGIEVHVGCATQYRAPDANTDWARAA